MVRKWKLLLTSGLLSCLPVGLVTALSISASDTSKIVTILKITNRQIDVNDPRLSERFQQAFAIQYGDQLDNLANRTDLIQLILKELITYQNQTSTLPIFATSFDFEQFYYQFSQLQSTNFNPDDAIVFSYSSNNQWKDLAAGILKINIKIGKNLQSTFLFENSQSETEIVFSGLLKQVDWYQRSTISGRDDWNETNVADDQIVKPYILANKGQQTLWDDIKNLQDPQGFVYRNLIKYEHQNGVVINGQNDEDLANYVLATNLDQSTTEQLGLIRDVQLEPFFASGKVKLTIDLEEQQWRDDKKPVLQDRFGNWNAITENQLITIWLGGWKKDYSFSTQTTNHSELSFDAKQIQVANKTLNEYSVKDLVTQIDNGDFSVIDQALINFSDYLDPDGAHKLVNTRLRYGEWKTIGGQIDYQILAQNQWSGDLKLQVSFDPNLIKQHFNQALGNGFKQMQQTNFVINFTNLKPLRILKQQANRFEWRWLNQTTIKDWFAIQDINQIDLIVIGEVVKKQLITYQNQTLDRDRVFITNATDLKQLNDFKITRFDPDWEQGVVEIEWEHPISANSNFNDQDYQSATVAKGSFTIKGFLAQANDQFDFKPANKTLQLDIRKYNQTNGVQPIDFASQIDQSWIVANLINFQDFNNKPNALFNTNAKLSDFYQKLLLPNGIQLSLNGDQSTIDGKIKLNSLYLKGDQQDPTFHFQIINLIAKKQFKHIPNLDGSEWNLDQIDRNWVFNNLISFNDRQVAKPALIVNQSARDWFNQSLLDLEINKSYWNHQVEIRFRFRDQPDLITVINQVAGRAKFIVNQQLDLKTQMLVNYQNENDLLEKLVNFDMQPTNEQAWLTTNVNQSEFMQHYFQNLNIINRDLYQNLLTFKATINGTQYQINLNFNPDTINVFDLDRQFQMEQPFVDDPGSWLKMIDFAGSRYGLKSWFRINITKEQFLAQSQLKLIDRDGMIGSANWELVSQVPFNSDHNKMIGIKTLNLSTFGLDASGTFSHENQVDAQLNDLLKEIKTFQDLNANFVYDQLIGYQDQSRTLIATTNLTKEQFQKVSQLTIINRQTNVEINFKFASKLNQGQVEQASIKITNLPFLKHTLSLFDINLIVTISALVVLVAIISTIVIVKVRARKHIQKILKEHQLKQENSIY